MAILGGCLVHWTMARRGSKGVDGGGGGGGGGGGRIKSICSSQSMCSSPRNFLSG